MIELKNPHGTATRREVYDLVKLIYTLAKTVREVEMDTPRSWRSRIFEIESSCDKFISDLNK
jgi:hypothetical protein